MRTPVNEAQIGREQKKLKRVNCLQKTKKKIKKQTHSGFQKNAPRQESKNEEKQTKKTALAPNATTKLCKRKCCFAGAAQPRVCVHTYCKILKEKMKNKKKLRKKRYIQYRPQDDRSTFFFVWLRGLALFLSLYCRVAPFFSHTRPPPYCELPPAVLPRIDSMMRLQVTRCQQNHRKQASRMSCSHINMPFVLS